MTDTPPSAEDRPAPQPEDSGASTASKPGVGTTIVKNSLWLLVDNVLGMVVSFYCSILVARGLGPDRMGEYNYLLWFAAVLKMVTEVAIPATFRKFAAELMGREDFSELKTLVRVALRLQAKLAGLGLSVGLVVVYFLFPASQVLIATLAVLTIVPGIFLSVPSGALWATENLRYNVLSSVTSMLVNAIGVSLSVFLHWGLVGLVASLLASRVCDCTLRFVLFRWRYARLPGVAHDHLDPDLRRRMVSFATLQLVLTLLYSLLFDRMEVFFLRLLAPTREIAFFSISFTLTQYLLIIPNTLANSASVSMMVKQGRAPAESARIAGTTTWFTILFAAPVLFGVAAVSDPLLRLLYGAKYLPAIPVLTALSLFALSLAASQPAQYLLVSAERQVFYLVWLIVAAAIDIVGNLLLIPPLGALGAAVGKGVSQFVAAVGFLGYMMRQFDVSLPWLRIAKLLAASAAMLGAVRLVGWRLPALPALVLGIPVGAAVFVVLMRWLRCLDPTDRDRLRQLARLMPSRTRGAYRAVIGFLAPVGLLVLLALAERPAAAQTVYTMDGAVNLGYSDTSVQGVERDPAETPTGNVHKLFTDVRPGIAAQFMSSRLVWNVGYVFAASLADDGTNTYSNSGNLSLATQLSPRSALTLSAGATQGGTAFQLNERAPEAANPEIRAPGSPNQFASSFAESFAWQASPYLRLTQGASTTVSAPEGDLSTVNSDSSASLGLDRVFAVDTVGASLTSSVARLQPVTAGTEPFFNIVNSLVARWAHDFGWRWSGQASAGVQQILTLTGSTPLAIVPTGSAAAQVQLGRTATAAVSYTRGATSNLQTGTVAMTDQVSVRGFASFDARHPRFLGISAGYLHSAPLGDAPIRVATGTGDALQGDVGLVWGLSDSVLATARYSVAYQFNQGAGVEPALAHVLTIGITGRYSTGRYTPPMPSFGRRVDESDPGGERR